MKIPNEGDSITLGDDNLYVFEVEGPGSRSTGMTGYGNPDSLDERYILTCHDRYGNEVEIRGYSDDA